MTHKLLKQVGNEWRSNLWLCIELLIVSIVLFVIALYLVTTYTTYRLPMGFDIDHTYLIDTERIDASSPEYIAPDEESDDESEIISQERLDLLRRVENLPFVESAAWSINSYPYNGSNSLSYIRVDTIGANLFTRYVTPGFIKVFRYESVDGLSIDSMVSLLSRNYVIVDDDILNPWGKTDNPKLSDIKVREFYIGSDTTNAYPIGAIVKKPRYYDFCNYGSMVMYNMTQAIGMLKNLTIRVYDKDDHDIREQIMEAAKSSLRSGNMIVTDVTPFWRIRHNYQQINYIAIRDRVACVAFLALNVFLGLLGTFWFRTKQRVPEIAIRKVNGATNASIFARLLTESMIVLIAASIVALPIDFLAVHYGIVPDYVFASWREPIISFLIVLGVLALVCSIGVMIPASKAMKLNAAQSLKEE